MKIFKVSLKYQIEPLADTLESRTIKKRGFIMQITSVQSFKGGTGKTVTAANLAHILAVVHQKRVLVVDLDEEGNLSQYFATYHENRVGIAEILTGEITDIHKVIHKTCYDNLDIIASNLNLYRAAKEIEQSGDGYILRNALKQVKNEYDFCIIDNAPVLNVKTAISLLASHNVIIPMRADNFSRLGLHPLLEQINNVKTENKNLYIKGILFTHYQNNEVNKQCLKVIVKENTDINIFRTKIRFNQHIMESTFSAQPLADISSRYGATMDYKKFTQEYLKSST